MMKVHIWPTPQEIGSDNGIGRVVLAQYEYLPKLGIELTGPISADVIAAHTQQAQLPRVDVLHCHGIYWTGDRDSGKYSTWHNTANSKIMDAARKAKAITVPSRWVQRPFQRDMRISPEIIGHGINVAEWSPGNTKNYVLWNKNRREDVCNPIPAWELARRGVRVLSTFSPENVPAIQNFEVIGKMSHEEMKEVIRNAEIYLSTTQETFGVGTLEAMACGIPVLGFSWAGTLDIVTHKVDGYLVQPGDYDGLFEGYEWLIDNWDNVSEAARSKAEQYNWPNVIQRYANLYQKVSEIPEETGVSIIITNYNYEKYVGEAIQTALAQSVVDEVIIVDDGSTDGSKKIIDKYKKNDKVKIIYQENSGVAAARNNGIESAKGDFVICLDADDRLHEKYAEILFNEMKEERDIGIAYTGLLVLKGEETGRTTWPPEFSWKVQTTLANPPTNCIPCAAMFRKKMWNRAGGYRQQFHPAEDVEFWTRGLSLGFRAKRVTNDPLFIYRVHSNGASRNKPYHRIDTWMPFIRDGIYPIASPTDTMPLVMSHDFPEVSVIVPVSPKHKKTVEISIESVIGQSFRAWELILVNDTGDEEWGDELLKTYPFMELINSGNLGSGAARNLGIQKAKAPYVLFLDADDYIHPEAIESMVMGAKSNPGNYVYSDWTVLEDNKVVETPEYDLDKISAELLHPVTCLVPSKIAKKILFDEDLPVLEDWDFYLRCALEGCYGVRYPKSLLYVRLSARTRTNKSRKLTVAKIREKYENSIRRIDKMSCSGCGGQISIKPTPVPAGASAPGLVRMAFIGIQKGATPWGGPGRSPSGQVYRGGDNPFDKFANVEPMDVSWLESFGVWKEVKRPEAITPKVVEVTEPAVATEVKVTEKKGQGRGKPDKVPA